MLLERFDPVLNGPQLVEIEFVNSALALPWLTETMPTSRSTPRCFETAGCGSPSGRRQWPPQPSRAPRKQVDDLPPPRLGNGVEDVGRGRCLRHAEIIFPLWNMSIAMRRFSAPGGADIPVCRRRIPTSSGATEARLRAFPRSGTRPGLEAGSAMAIKGIRRGFVQARCGV